MSAAPDAEGRLAGCKAQCLRELNGPGFNEVLSQETPRALEMDPHMQQEHQKHVASLPQMDTHRGCFFTPYSYRPDKPSGERCNQMATNHRQSVLRALPCLWAPMSSCETGVTIEMSRDFGHSDDRSVILASVRRDMLTCPTPAQACPLPMPCRHWFLWCFEVQRRSIHCDNVSFLLPR